jgi:predicted nucleotidyltransferase
MPVRLLNSFVLKWPDVRTVDKALRSWAKKLGEKHSNILCIGYFGSYAKGNWGVGSDLDLIIIVENSEKPFINRAAEWDTTKLPVPADLLVYTKSEWQSLLSHSLFYQNLIKEIVWIFEKIKLVRENH